MRLSISAFVILVPLMSSAASNLDLSHLGKKESPIVEPAAERDGVEEEVISSHVYSSGSSEIGVRRNIEMVKPNTEHLNLPKPLSKPANDDTSVFAFVDEALGIEPVKPWQKGTLAKKEMKPGGPVPEFDLFSEKVFSYKQGSVGGSGVGGGGCGCN
ncbi:hypothetical protein GCM10007938_29000 [Vibrio zhanjiangensis]|uniref:DUF4266 domain-containing protein n=1 Tax=Vibrio zhanjiangensis TaxID=1046128 RepID=A0ABQ6F0W0_9VIBR|nr:DUF4266 domain-containing protein [Vibrio zhanjiangensis]GLT19118.1 hypothetical protein GCM10007938_29000 [Vibrio zhanjiangensis]